MKKLGEHNELIESLLSDLYLETIQAKHRLKSWRQGGIRATLWRLIAMAVGVIGVIWALINC